MFKPRMISIGDEFPHFTLQGVNKDNNFVEVSVSKEYEPLKHDYTVIYFYPKDFTFICPTEIAGMDMLVDEANVIGISGDNEFCKLAWKQSNELIGNIQHSLAADCGMGLASNLGIVNEEAGVCYRATYIIDKNSVIQHISVNTLDTGRNAHEVLRTLQAIKAGGLTGCEWTPGDEFVG